MNTLTERDAVITFNYDRVVEELMSRTGKRPGKFLKLHGSVPTPSELRRLVEEGKGIDTISTPGPQKTHAAKNHLASEWEKAAQALQDAQQLVVVGYSFPATDASVGALVLRNCGASRITIVVGHDPIGEAVHAMFSRLIRGRGVRNTMLLAEQFLTEGSVRPRNGRFDHELFGR
jgi:hypothetical protein